MIDIQILRIMKHRKGFMKLFHAIPRKALDPQTNAIIDDLKDYFDAFDHDVVNLETFLPRFRRRHPAFTDETFAVYVGVMRSMMDDVDENTRAGILQEMHELTLGAALANLAVEFEEGNVPDLPGSISEALDRYRVDSGIKGHAYVEDDIWDLLRDELDEVGLKWRLHCLNEAMRPVRGGDFGIVAARPDQGKTTFLADTVTCFAPQLPNERNILWLNNEGKGSRIKPRLYQSALNMTLDQLIAMSATQETKDHLISMYRTAVGGRLDKIRIVDIHGYSTFQVETLIEENNPGVVIFDMIDHIRGFGGEARTDLQLEEMYKWARERCVKYDMVGLASSQISNDGDGLQYPTLGMLKDSKTGKQGACDFQLMIGSVNDVNLRTSRFLSLPKNKLRRPGGIAELRQEVRYHPDRVRYEDVPVGA